MLPAWITALAIIGALLALRDLIRPLARFWSDPPRRRQRYYVGGGTAKIVSIDRSVDYTVLCRRNRHEFIRLRDLG